MKLDQRDPPTESSSGGGPAPAQRGTEFRAVEGGSEMVSGGTLLVEAYAALWLILLGFLLVSWRRQSRIDARVAELERSMARPGERVGVTVGSAK
jgi:hypothetical protein